MAYKWLISCICPEIVIEYSYEKMVYAISILSNTSEYNDFICFRHYRKNLISIHAAL